MQIIKKDGRVESYNFEKIRAAVTKSADRISVIFSNHQWTKLEKILLDLLANQEEISVQQMHLKVEQALSEVDPGVAEAYRNYRNYKRDFVGMMDSVLRSADALNYQIDRSNANTTAALISSQRSLISKEMYKKVFLANDELQAIEDGYIYIHDLGSRLQTYNCCLFDMGRVLHGGFEWEHIGYNEPKDVRTAGNLISDITLNCAAQQYGGFTISEVDSILAPYARKSYNRYMREYMEIALDNNNLLEPTAPEVKARIYALKRVTRDIEQVFQGFEHTFNIVASSRGDYPFVTMTGGCEEDEFGQLVWETALKVRRKGQGKPGHRRPAIFPKLVFLYTEKLHGEGKPLHHLFIEAILTSAKSMYPDYLSLDMPNENLLRSDTYRMHFEPAIAKVFHKYHQFGQSRWLLDEDESVYENPQWIDSIISPMGKCKLQPM